MNRIIPVLIISQAPLFGFVRQNEEKGWSRDFDGSTFSVLSFLLIFVMEIFCSRLDNVVRLEKVWKRFSIEELEV